MGINYYHRTNICECCNRYDERHIGKSSGGWSFSFQGFRPWEGSEGPKIESYTDWLKLLRTGGKIFDEDGEEINLPDFEKMVAAKVGGTQHAEYVRTHPQHSRYYKPEEDWLDADGHSFTLTSFS